MLRSFWAWALSGLVLASAPLAAADGEPRGATEETLAQRGYRLLTTKAYLSPDFDQETFDELWQTWEEPLRTQAQAASLEERRKMAFARYGLTPAPDREGPVALQYVDDGHGGWVMSVGYSGDGRHVVSGSEDGTVRVWEVVREVGRPEPDRCTRPRTLGRLRAHTRSRNPSAERRKKDKSAGLGTTHAGYLGERIRGHLLEGGGGVHRPRCHCLQAMDEHEPAPQGG